MGDSAVMLASCCGVVYTSSMMLMIVVASWSPMTALRVKSPEAVHIRGLVRVRTPLLMTPTNSPSR